LSELLSKETLLFIAASMETLNHPKPETAHILFLDAVGYSTLPLDRQTAVFRGLQEIVNNSPTVAEAASRDEVIRTPTGDGMVLAFFDHCSSALRCARELGEQIKGGFTVRMGLHTGEVVRQLDVNGNMNLSGDGINIAQRVMDFGDGGHILMSLAYATELQRAGDPAAADCHDIGVASAKHGMQIHLYNYHRPAVGSADVPARVRMDDRWVRPSELRLGTSGHSLIVATLQILGWLLARPLQWRTHVTQIDPRLSPNFSVIDLTGPQIRRNRDLRALLLQVYVVCPALLSLLVLAVLLPFPKGHGISAFAAVFTMISMGYLVSILLGIGAAFVGFVILAFQDIVQAPAVRIFGQYSLGNAITLAAVCAWAFVSLCAVFPRHRRLPVWREVIVAILSAALTIAMYQVPIALTPKEPHLYRAVVVGLIGFLFVTLINGMRWRRWARGFVFGQVTGILLGLGLFAYNGFPKGPPFFTGDIIAGITDGLFSAVAWAMAFALAERFADSRSAIASGLLATIFFNNPGKTWLIPFAILWIAYGWMRHRSQPTE
jgi:class 3 adenylate cyclase